MKESRKIQCCPFCFKCRENFDCFQREGEDLKWKMLMVIRLLDCWYALKICSRDLKIICWKIKNLIVVIFFSLNEVKINRFLLFLTVIDFSWLRLDKLIGTTAITKHYCQYRKDIGLLRMINFTQTSSKQVKSSHSQKNENQFSFLSYS